MARPATIGDRKRLTKDELECAAAVLAALRDSPPESRMGGLVAALQIFLTKRDVFALLEQDSECPTDT